MKLYLAPMDGVVDWVMRDLLTQIGGIDQCVTEFIRVVDVLYPDHVFYKKCPELKTGGKTRAGTPVFVQILGSQIEAMAINAQRAVELGALGIDINFGCPARTVNRNDGGATLLKSSERIYNIVKEVRKVVPLQIPVTVKIRLGYEDQSSCLDVAQAIEEAGASLLTVHCRTKMDAYKPPAYWEWIPRIQERCQLEIVVNGEIWNLKDFHRCQEISGGLNFMIGRGAVADPYLFQRIKGAYLEANWSQTKTLLSSFYNESLLFNNENFAITRTKQWLKSLAINHVEAKDLFDSCRRLTNGCDFKEAIYRASHTS